MWWEGADCVVGCCACGGGAVCVVGAMHAVGGYMGNLCTSPSILL